MLSRFSSFLFLSFLGLIAFSSCKKETSTIMPVNELDGLQLASSFTDSLNGNIVSLFTPSGKFQTGYNDVFLQIKDKSGNLINNATITWTPTMVMMSNSHGCPASGIIKKANALFTYQGYLAFQMASNSSEYWKLTIQYNINGQSFKTNGVINVVPSTARTLQSFVGNDGMRYVVALAEPQQPKAGINDMVAIVYQMPSSFSFIPVSGYKLKIDPRMPSMGNHSSPNNQDLTQGADQKYYGKLSLTMTGQWRINMQLLNAADSIIMGEQITPSNESSSLYFDISF
ncbi:MAG: FixH family protein [Bacteroidetes bacterium]|nr:FixH family protein [Bacteroidota bacterium]